MRELEIMSRVTKMLEEGKAEELLSALDTIDSLNESSNQHDNNHNLESEELNRKKSNDNSNNENINNDNYDENDDFDSKEIWEDEEYDDEEYEDEYENHNGNILLDVLDKVSEGASGIDNPIPLLEISTIYGNAIVVDLRNYKTTINKIREVLTDYTCLPAIITTDGIESKKDMEDNNLEFALILNKQDLDDKYTYHLLLSHVGYELMMKGCVASDLVDMKNAIAFLTSLNKQPLELPLLGYKVLKPNRCCKGHKYENNKYYHTDEEIELHENGYHFATKPITLVDWYNPFSTDNIIVRVQAGPKIIYNPSIDVVVSDGLMILEELAWNILNL